MKNIKESDEKSPDTNSSPASYSNMYPNNKNVSDYPSIKEITIPEKEESEQIQLLNLKYSTNHLMGFDEFRKATRLFGDEYIIILKALWYGVLSCINSEVKLKLNQIETDGRIHLLIPLKSGKGKRELKRVIKDTFESLNKLADEPTSLHPEQLVGKTIRRNNKGNIDYEQIEGYLSRDYLIIDEGRTLLTSDDLIFSESRRYLRLAQDSYPYNEISKKSVDIPFGEELTFTPYVGTCIFTQPYYFNEDFATDGDLRRYIVPYVNMSGMDRINAYKDRIFNQTDSKQSLSIFVNYVNSLDDYKTFKFSNDAIPDFLKNSILLIQRGLSYSKKVRNFADLYDFTIQDLLLKMCAVQALQNGKDTIEKEHVSLAFIDLVEFVEHMYEFVRLKIVGMMDYGEGWAGSVGKDRIVLEWLYNTGATSEESSKVSINNYEEKIMEIFNIKERRARSIKQEHEFKGWIKSKKYPGTSKIWIDFKPNNSLQATPATGALQVQKKYDEILKKNSTKTAPNTPIAPINVNGKNQIEKIKDNNKIKYESLEDDELWKLGNLEDDEKAMDELNIRLLKPKEESV